ncbi:MAG: hypothetical protein ABIJ56_24110 [Pseudomonadota bacterium]
MKKSIDALIDEELLKRAKREAFSRRIALSRLMEKALTAYLNAIDTKVEARGRGLVAKTAGIMKVPPEVLKAIMEE